MAAEDCTVEIIQGDWPRAAEVEDLVYEVLYRDFGVEREGHWRQPACDEVQAVALCGAALVGTARILGSRDETGRQLRQVAVVESYRGSGVGRALVVALEDEARSQGATEVWLNAREEAYPFYERLGYTYAGTTFVSELTKIPHRPMRKAL